MSPFCNRTLEEERVVETPLSIGITFHTLGLIVCAVFGLIAVIMSVYLQYMHATHYLKPYEQKHIIRILFMVPIFCIVSFLSYYYYYHTVYYQVLRDCYEAFAISSFFSLLCAYVAPSLKDQKEYFRSINPKPWVWPLKWGKRSFFRTPRSGLTWFNIVWFCIFQYCFINVLMTFVGVVAQATNRYCLDSLNPAFAHVWVTVMEGGAVTVAMYNVIQYYIQLRGDIAEHRPFLKVLAIKGVIFFSFWQGLVIDFASSSGALKASATLSEQDIRVGIPSTLLCIEMAGFSLLHLWAYPWHEYDVKRSAAVASETPGGFDLDSEPKYHGGRFGYKAFLDAYNMWDIIKAVGRSFRWMAVGRRYRTDDSSYKQHTMNSLGETAALKQNGAYQKLSDSREHSPEPNSFGLPSRGGANAPPQQPFGGGVSGGVASQQHPYNHSGHQNTLSMPAPAQTAYSGAGAHDTAYHGATNTRPPAPGTMEMPDPSQYR